MKKDHFGNGVGSILLFFAGLTLSVAGLMIISTSTPRPVYLGWLYLWAAVALAVFTARLWRRVLPGVFACGAVNGIYMALTGHAIGQRKPVSEGTTLGLTVLLLITAVLSQRVSKLGQPVDATDRVAYAAFFLLFTIAFAVQWAAIVALVCMLLIVGFIILRHRHESKDGNSTATA